ncbi:MAG: hypothetical protein M3256_05550 [Actinomycetota bacterium]|nr:hypothetical protein [Actinomycetota bacterium]
MSVGALVSGLVLLIYAGFVLSSSGRAIEGRSRAQILVGRLRAGVWALLAVAAVSSSFGAYLLAGLSAFAAVAAGLSAVLWSRRR